MPSPTASTVSPVLALMLTRFVSISSASAMPSVILRMNGCSFGRFKMNSRININDRITVLLHQPDRKPQKHKAFGISPAFVAVWKMRADIAERQRPEQSRRSSHASIHQHPNAHRRRDPIRSSTPPRTSLRPGDQPMNISSKSDAMHEKNKEQLRVISSVSWSNNRASANNEVFRDA